MAYEIFAQVYDEFTENVQYKKRAEYICSLFFAKSPNISSEDFKNSLKGKTLLDLACGTGSLSLEFCRQGFDVIGIDNSPDMLSQAQSKLISNSCNALLLCQDMKSFDLYGTVDFVVCSLDSLNHLIEKEDILSVFKRVNLFLNKGGTFVFDLNTPYKHKNILANNAYIYESKKAYLAWQNSYLGKGRVKIDLDIFIKDKNVYKRHKESFFEQAYLDSFILEALKNTGFNQISSYDDLTLMPPHDKSERIYYVAKK